MKKSHEILWAKSVDKEIDFDGNGESLYQHSLNVANNARKICAIEAQPTTMGFVQVWLDFVAIGIINIAAFVRAGQTSLNICSYYLTLSKAKQRFRAERNSNATPATKP